METALPNLHPALVHFPVVLVPLALALDLTWLAQRSPATSRFGALAWLLAALSAAAAFVAGRFAADGLVGVPPLAQPAIGDHANWATASVGLAGLVALLRVAAEWRPEARWNPPLRGAALAVAIGLGGVVFITADKGGALVYQHALAVTPPECEVCALPDAPPEPQPEAAPLLLPDGGQWVWSPSETHASQLSATRWPERGAAYAISGAHTLTFEPELGDVQVNAWLDLSGFEGEVHFLHHVEGDMGGAFALSTSGSARLLDLAPEPSELDQAAVALKGRHALAVNASGSHLKGMLDGKMVVHGHAPARQPGRVALRFEGSGVIGIERVEIVPLEGP